MKLVTKLLVACAILAAMQLAIVHAIPYSLAASGLKFGPCPDDGSGSGPPPVFPVKVKPDPIAKKQNETFSYTGPIPAEITETFVVTPIYLTPDMEPLDPQTTCVQPVCYGKDCPIKAKGKFIQKDLVCPAPSSLPSSYIVAFLMGDAETNSVVACSMAKVGKAAAESKSTINYHAMISH